METTASTFTLSVLRSFDGSEETVITVDKINQKIIFNRDKSGLGDKGIRKANVNLVDDEELILHLFVDHSSLEVFVNNGKVVMSGRVYPNQNSQGLQLSSFAGEVVIKQIDIWNLANIWK